MAVPFEFYFISGQRSAGIIQKVNRMIEIFSNNKELLKIKKIMRGGLKYRDFFRYLISDTEKLVWQRVRRKSKKKQ